ncbi:dolichyl-phosphate-mannose-protein mannosyltransferase [Halopolyspora algeriensis]|uniref:Dolichyl-phosphate-mannose-protein mannosyltransferase n=1 Tax=Halopolyspora algeriensis TaxID=1500506 RepID=A0A368VQ46_9ACTN|nr:glycosyltransferase family 39 protein [Halopolyspora algeriensis]RCW43618.1 dolichyl-phosphate-mannose-protein mannosyltransferase [Halopolyspora algeriensis]TQM47597.1 dolichyl-phosphate-mannose-protein mannosyltransferase [Halopolyspora algeriensis]
MTSTISAPAEMPARARLAPPATVPVLLIAGAMGLLLAAASSRYGYFGDELYFLAAGDHLAWGYADQQPLVPLLARMMEFLFPGSPLGLRLPAILVTAAGVPLTALLARELGADRRAQVLAAGAFAICPQFLLNGRLLGTMTFDPILWVLLTWLLVRWVRLRQDGRGDDRLLLWAGVTTAVAIQVKFLVVGFWAAAGIALLLTGPRDVLRRPKLWAGAAIVVLTTIPTLIWQATHGWPQLGMAGVINAESQADGAVLLKRALIIAGTVGAVLLCYGLLKLLRSAELRPYRFLGVTFLLLAAIFVSTGAREYYLAGMYPLLWAVGAVGLQRRREVRTRPRGTWLAWPVYALSAVICVSTLTPNPLVSALPGDLVNHSGEQWPVLARDTAAALHSLPAEEQQHTAVIAASYWSAAALHHFGPRYGIHTVYSGSRGYGYFGRPPEATRAVLYVGSTRRSLQRHFDSVRRIATVSPGTEPHNGRPIWLAEERKAPWSQLWPEVRGMAMWQ